MVQDKRYTSEPKSYRVLKGQHCEGSQPDTKGFDGEVIKGKQRIYKQGEIVTTRRNLLLHNNGPGERFEKFRLVPDGFVAPDSFDVMTVAQLREHADIEEIDVTDCHKKQEIIDAIREQTAAMV